MGVKIETIKEGNGVSFPQTGKTVIVYYTGKLPRGEDAFNLFRDNGDYFEFEIGVGQVIKGWDEGITRMSIGQRARLVCTPDYAYGPSGIAGCIPPNMALIFDVELIAIR